MTFGTVVAHYVTEDGVTPLSGHVKFVLSAPVVLTAVAGEPVTMVPQNVSAPLDADGRISIVLQATDDPDATPTNTQWIAIPALSDGRVPVRAPRVPFFLPGGSTVDLTEVAPVAVASPSLSLLTAAQIEALIGDASQADAAAAAAAASAAAAEASAIAAAEAAAASGGEAAAAAAALAAAEASASAASASAAAATAADVASDAMVGITEHVASQLPHTVYDDMPDLTLILENGMV